MPAMQEWEKERFRKRNFIVDAHFSPFSSPPFSLQNATQRFRRLPGLLRAGVGIADRAADILVAEQLPHFPQILSHVVDQNCCRAVAQACAVISPPPRALHAARSRKLNARWSPPNTPQK